jgi:hypothetical protein
LAQSRRWKGEIDGRENEQLFCFQRVNWSGRGDLNARPPAPKLSTLGVQRTPRLPISINTSHRYKPSEARIARANKPKNGWLKPHLRHKPRHKPPEVYDEDDPSSLGGSECKKGAD